MANGDKPKPIGPWQRRSRRQVYDNPWIEVLHDEVITPGNTEGIYGVVHFKTRAIGIVPIDEDGNTYLVHQFRYPLDKESWEIPEGGGALDEDPIAAARRELKEETGLSGGRWQCLMNMHLSNSICDEEAIIYLARDLTQGEQQLGATESDLTVKKLPLQEAIDMALNGQITDAISVAALLRVELLLRSGEKL